VDDELALAVRGWVQDPGGRGIRAGRRRERQHGGHQCEPVWLFHGGYYSLLRGRPDFRWTSSCHSLETCPPWISLDFYNRMPGGPKTGTTGSHALRGDGRGSYALDFGDAG